MNDSGELATEAAEEVGIEEAEKLILQWDPTASPASDDRMLFSDGANRGEADRFLRAVDEIRRSISSDPVTASPKRLSSSSACSSPANAIQIAIARLDAIQDLRTIAGNMFAAGYGRECVQVYSSVRKSAIDLSLRHLGIEKLSIGDVQRLEWEALESKIRRWIRAAGSAGSLLVLWRGRRRMEEGAGGDGDILGF